MKSVYLNKINQMTSFHCMCVFDSFHLYVIYRGNYKERFSISGRCFFILYKIFEKDDCDAIKKEKNVRCFSG